MTVVFRRRRSFTILINARRIFTGFYCLFLLMFEYQYYEHIDFLILGKVGINNWRGCATSVANYLQVVKFDEYKTH